MTRLTWHGAKVDSPADANREVKMLWDKMKIDCILLHMHLRRRACLPCIRIHPHAYSLGAFIIAE